MNFDLPKAKYVIAVSGGVDSVVLLDVLVANPRGSEFVVAHFDHGIRQDSKLDADFVESLAKKYNLQFVTERTELGSGASEDQARVARYNFLRRACELHNASAIIAAHHQDDLIETILLHVRRGTGRAGLTPMQTSGIVRPLLYVPKKDIVHYARQHNLSWREDSTNKDQTYARNKIRAALAHASEKDKNWLLDIHKKMLITNAEIRTGLADVYDYCVANNAIIRSRFVILPYALQSEVVYTWLTNNHVPNIQSSLIDRTVVACKVYKQHKKMPLTKNVELLSHRL
ncbi:tRNA lysidine(34) synthetase TilS [bacterium]|nr:tRNA lysidine(34) synthetase TilS [bacterium]